MATIKPILNEVQKGKIKSGAERRLYEAFSQQFSSNDWLILYNCRFIEKKWPHSPPIDGEIDFLVVHPNWGTLLIEVKGGNITYDGHTLYQNNDPTDLEGQLEKNKYGALERLEKRPDWDPLFKKRFYHAVAFPDGNFKGNKFPAWLDSKILIDQSDLANLENRLFEIFQFHSNSRKIDLEQGRLFRYLIEDSFMPGLPKIKLYQDVEKKINELTEGQEIIIRVITAGLRRAAIRGGAGSGKTILGLMKALELAGHGLNTLIIVFNRALKEFLETQVRQNLGMTSDQDLSEPAHPGYGRLEVMTFHELCGTAIRRTQTKVPPPGDNKQEYYDKVLPEILFEIVSEHPEVQYDAIIVDEGQDLHESWWLSLEACLRHGRDSFFYVFFDDNQILRPQGGKIPEDLTVFPLTENVRNTQEIHRELTRFYKSKQTYVSKGPSGFHLETFEYKNGIDLRKSLEEKILELHREMKIAFTDICVLTTKEVDTNSFILEHLNKSISGIFRWVDATVKVRGKPSKEISQLPIVQVSSINRFKGLESPVVILVEIDEGFLTQDNWQESCYVGFSRAKAHLLIYGTAPALKQLLSPI